MIEKYVLQAICHTMPPYFIIDRRVCASIDLFELYQTVESKHNYIAAIRLIEL
jgi:hypothetical protein